VEGLIQGKIKQLIQDELPRQSSVAGWMRMLHRVLSWIMDLQAAAREGNVADSAGHHATCCRG